jgi:transcriptional regulator with XRE-family HTH domain
MKKISDCFGSNIKRRRIALGMTQGDLARRVQVSVETVRNIEKGRKWVTTRTVARFAKALKASEVDLFEDIERGNWTQALGRFFQILSKVPPDILETLSERDDWDAIRIVIKRERRKMAKQSKRR